MTTMNMTLVLTGPYAGRSINLNGRRFINGELKLRGKPESFSGVIAYMARCYQAYPKGSDELAEAQERDNEGEARENKSSGARVQEAKGDRSTRSRSADEDGDDDESEIDDEDETAGDSDLEDDEDENSPGLSEDGRSLRSAVMKLDYSNDDHWTVAGLPKISSVASIYGEDVSRSDIESVAGHWNRDRARETAEL